MFATSPLILLLAASLASATSLPIGRATTYQVCAVCPLVDTKGNTVSPGSGYGKTPPVKFCGYILSIGLIDEGLERIPVLLSREQRSVLLDLLQSLSHRTASWSQSRGYPEIVAVRIGSLRNIDLYTPENCCG
ncbi:hypothetical protein B0H14DRAFT_2611047 [Mycena olivaceomarginata]|nr:hypothetical protein B0H14DRAFT_2611047 [Mycena olivaceomarginata]